MLTGYMTKQTLRMALGQFNPTVGDLEGNVDRIIDMIAEAQTVFASDMIVFPELAVTGYPPEDLLFRSDFIGKASKALHTIAAHTFNIDCVVGFPRENNGLLYNSAAYLRGGNVCAVYDKRILPNYGVFDEKRYFATGSTPCVLKLKGWTFALTICEDIWDVMPIQTSVAEGAEFIVNINASPYHMGKIGERKYMLMQRCRENKVPVFYVHMVGGQDELVFDGSSLVLNAAGELVHQGASFAASLQVLEMDESGIHSLQGNVLPVADHEAQRIYDALVLGVRDYVSKNGFEGVVLGLSGGIDSALTACIAVDALGSANVEAVMMPTRYTSQMSLEDAAALAQQLGIAYSVLDIEPVFQSAMQVLAPVLSGQAVDTTEENLQSRCRGLVLMAISNKKRCLLLATGNKSEMAVGYATLYGDMAGAFAPLKDISKTWVYALCHYRNEQSSVIPQRVFERAPSAELAPNQKDEDSLPPYAQLDKILELYIEQDQSIDAIIAQGYGKALVHDIVHRVNLNEYKRRQAAPGVKVTRCAFGRERRYPITSKYDR